MVWYCSNRERTNKKKKTKENKIYNDRSKISMYHKCYFCCTNRRM